MKNKNVLMINDLIKNATLSHDKVALNAYKNLKTEFEKFKYAQKLPRKLDSEIELRIISKYAKSLEDAISQFSEAHREDLVSEYTSELEVVKKLLPEPVNESQIRSYLLSMEFQKILHPENFEKIEKLEKLGIVGLNIEIPKKEMGTVIKHLKSKFPTADGKMISDIVKKYVV